MGLDSWYHWVQSGIGFQASFSEQRKAWFVVPRAISKCDQSLLAEISQRQSKAAGTLCSCTICLPESWKAHIQEEFELLFTACPGVLNLISSEVWEETVGTKNSLGLLYCETRHLLPHNNPGRSETVLLALYRWDTNEHRDSMYSSPPWDPELWGKEPECKARHT